MSGIGSTISGILGLTGNAPGGSVPNIINPFTPLPITDPFSQIPIQDPFQQIPVTDPFVAPTPFQGPDITDPFQRISVTDPFQSIPFVDLNSIGLTGPQQQLSDFLGSEQDARTRDIYARLGLGGSTMQAQDLGANELQRLAESAGLIQQNEQLALTEQGQRLQEQQTQTTSGLSTQAQRLQQEQAAANAGISTEGLQLQEATTAASSGLQEATAASNAGLTTQAQQLQQQRDAANAALTAQSQGLTQEQAAANAALTAQGQSLQELALGTNAGIQTQQLQLQAQNQANKQGQTALSNLFGGLGSVGSSLGSLVSQLNPFSTSTPSPNLAPG